MGERDSAHLYSLTLARIRTCALAVDDEDQAQCKSHSDQWGTVMLCTLCGGGYGINGVRWCARAPIHQCLHEDQAYTHLHLPLARSALHRLVRIRPDYLSPCFACSLSDTVLLSRAHTQHSPALPRILPQPERSKNIRSSCVTRACVTLPRLLSFAAPRRRHGSGR